MMFFILVDFNPGCTEVQGAIKLSIWRSRTTISPCPFHKRIKDPLNVFQSSLGTSVLQKLDFSYSQLSPPFFFPPKVIFLIS